MNEKEKKSYLEKYKEAKEKGVPFFPDILYKDAIAGLVVFIILVALAYFIGAPLEARANPADTTYTPRPEWYFLFLFQLLKYFPGKLEVIGVIVIPTLAILLLFLLPFLDKSPRRHFLKRPIITAGTLIALGGIIFLTIQSIREAPPPEAVAAGDQTAQLYAVNCAPCHGESITVTPGTDLHKIIAQGSHAGMPAWGADIPSDQIDALVGYVLSPGGSQLFTQNCSTCHKVTDLVASNPLELKNALDQGRNYPPHAGLNIPDWSTVMKSDERSRILNFLVAPDGARLFAIYCSPCHGQSVAFSGSEADLETTITKGGLHLDMPSWQPSLKPEEIDVLAKYVANPEQNPSGNTLFVAHCQSCHGQRIPTATSVDDAKNTISSGGVHRTMPVWGNILQPEAVDALVQYIVQTAKGNFPEAGQKLFVDNCSACHGYFGEGGPNPGQPGTIIPPISSSEFLSTRDDTTIQAIIARGQPDLGMTPFGSSFGGPLDDDGIAAIVAYIRSWEANPPAQVPPAPAQPTPAAQPSLSGKEIYTLVCSTCHGANGEGGSGPALNTAEFQSANTDQDIFNAISAGRENTQMMAWGGILSPDKINLVVSFIRSFHTAVSGTSQPGPFFARDVMPIIQAKCAACHGSLGGWNATSYSSFMTSGTHAPVVIPGNALQSLLIQKLNGTQTSGVAMPPGGKLTDSEIQIIINWIMAGALDN
jgi:mono/diheme cytochrome c family protein